MSETYQPPVEFMLEVLREDWARVNEERLALWAQNQFQAKVIEGLKFQLESHSHDPMDDVLSFLEELDTDTLDKYLANDTDLSLSPTVALVNVLKELARAGPGESSPQD